MRTRGEAQIEKAKQARQEAVMLSGRNHTSSEMASIIRDNGSEIELFLKEVIYSGKHNGWNFVRLIDELQQFGVGQNIIDDLHTVRNEYNCAKHDPTYPAPPERIIQTLGIAVSAIEALQNAGIGDINSAATQTYRRTFWIGTWYHIIGGDIEIHICLPAIDSLFPPDFDMIYIDGSSWDRAVSTFLKSGELRLGKGTIPDKLYDFWYGEGDFLAAGVFHGNYRELMSVLSANERREDLLPFLKRVDDIIAVWNAMLLGIVDLSTEELTGDTDEVAAQLVKIVSDRYAIPRHTPIARALVPDLANLLMSTLRPSGIS
jgi:hypothetical protein